MKLSILFLWFQPARLIQRSGWMALFVCIGLLFNINAHAQTVQTIPPFDALVVDTAGLLTPSEKEALLQKLLAFEKAKGSQIAVVIVPTTAPEDMFSYAHRLAVTNKLGAKISVTVYWLRLRSMTIGFGYTPCATLRVQFPIWQPAASLKNTSALHSSKGNTLRV